MKKIILFILLYSNFLYSYDLTDTSLATTYASGLSFSTLEACESTIPTTAYDNLGSLSTTQGECPTLPTLNFTATQDVSVYYNWSACYWSSAHNAYRSDCSNDIGTYCHYDCNASEILIDGVCTVDPNAPEGDNDNDGVPNKCDSDHELYSTFDCDSDTLSNAVDDDIDDDGIPNSMDTENYTGFYDSSTDTTINIDGDLLNTDNCLGPNLAEPTFYGTLYKKFEYTDRGVTYGTCQFFIQESNIDGAYQYPDLSLSCEKEYCFVHLLEPDCSSNIDDFRPDGDNWVYYSTAKTEQECIDIHETQFFTGALFTIDEKLNCDPVPYCFLQHKPLTEQEQEDFNNTVIDLNSTTLELAPLLDATNITNQHLVDIKKKQDTTNKSLNSLDDLLNKINDDTSNINSDLDTLISEQTKTNTELKAGLKSIKDSIDSASLANSTTINNVNNTSTTINNNLVNILRYGLGLNDSSDSQITDKGSVLNEFATSADNMKDDYDEIIGDFELLKDSLINGFTNNLPTDVGGSCVMSYNIDFVFGTLPINMNPCEVIAPLYNVLYTIFYLVFFSSFLFLSFNLLIHTKGN